MDKASAVDGAEAAIVRYAETDEDAIAIHRFLLVVAADSMIGKVDHIKSASEVWRVCRDECAIMLIHKGMMVGTMGVIAVDWWYGPDTFMTDRWHFVLPDYKNTVHAKLLKQEAEAVAKAANMPFIDQGKIRISSNGRKLMMPRITMPATGED